MNHLLSFTRFVSSHFVPPVLSSPFISNTFPCTDSAFLSSKEREQGSCHWQGVSELPDKRSAHISQKFTAAPVSIWLHLNCALNLNEENETNSVGAAAVTLHASCRKLKDFCLDHVSSPMTTAGRFVLSQDCMETTLRCIFAFLVI